MGNTSDRVLVKAWNRILGREQNVQCSYNQLKVITADHAMIHEGVGFYASHVESIASGGIHMMLLVPNQDGVHLRQNKVVVTGAPCTIKLYEACSYSAANSQATIFNMNRSSSKVSSSELFANPTIVVTGTVIETTLIPVTAKDSGGLSEGPDQEWVLDGAGPYLLGVKNDSGAATTAGMKLFWYEPGLLQ